MAKFKAVLFDLDGTLINTLDDLGDATNYMLAHFGHPQHEIESYKMMVGNGIRKLVERALPEKSRTKDDIDKGMDIFMPYYSEHSLDKTRPYDGVAKLILAVRELGLKTAVVTNKAEAAAIAILDNLYPDCFDVIIGQRDNMPTKPDPAGAHLAMEQLGVEPSECIFMGDSGVDIQTAVNSGAHPVGVLWGFRQRDELLSNGAKDIISSPSELMKLL